eukprot:Partr_v1_DN23651_c0_g1_i1_m19088
MTIFLRCVEEGSRLRVRIITPGYLSDANCQFPRALRRPLRYFSVPGDAITLVQGSGGSFYYRVAKSSITVRDDEPSMREIVEGLNAEQYHHNHHDESMAAATSDRATRKRSRASKASTPSKASRNTIDQKPQKPDKVFDDPDEPDCVICLGEVKAVILVPCGHYCLCSACAGTLCSTTKKCPMCRTGIQNTCLPSQVG